MTLPLLSKSHPDIQTAQRRIAETVNNILTFQHDDSRVRSIAEINAGVTPTNYAYSAKPIDVLRYDILPNDASRRALNSAKLKALLDFTQTGPRGLLYFPPSPAMTPTTSMPR